MARNLFTFMALALLLWGCASPPRQELQAARTAVAQAYAGGAHQLAPIEYQAASAALKDGEDLVRRGKYGLAKEILPFAEAHAQRATLKAREEQANLELQKIREQKEKAPDKPKQLPTKQTQKAIKKALNRPAKAKPAPPPPPLVRYTVTNGETLWTIAARKEVYVDALLWPLLYKANRDQIKDPRQIYPGQVLSIPRELTKAEREEARETARQSDIFPVELLIKNSPTTN